MVNGRLGNTTNPSDLFVPVKSAGLTFPIDGTPAPLFNPPTVRIFSRARSGFEAP
jgi:hypothetical protein